jgi:hypothetical protein
MVSCAGHATAGCDENTAGTRQRENKKNKALNELHTFFRKQKQIKGDDLLWGIWKITVDFICHACYYLQADREMRENGREH